MLKSDLNLSAGEGFIAYVRRNRLADPLALHLAGGQALVCSTAAAERLQKGEKT